MLGREDMEAREARELSAYAMKSAASRGRAHPEKEHPLRTAYQRDKERIIHATAFRRLQYKTQVFVNHEGDHYRTRLTHTMEVAQIARAIARVLNVNEDLTEAVALAHDLGHTPFGHSGEDALRELMADHGGFEHNVHGLRVVDLLEDRYLAFRGLNLTWEVREAIAKHVTAYDLPSVREFDPNLRMSVEGQIVEAADGIAYISHDLDDALGAGILDEGVFNASSLLKEIFEDVTARRPGLADRYRRTESVRALINRLVTDLCTVTVARIREMAPDSPEAVRRAPENVVAFSPDLQPRKDELQQYLFDNVYQHYRVVRMATKARRCVRELFNAYVADRRQLPPYYQAWAAREGLHQGVCDYIAGMTDRYAQDEHRRLFAPYESV